jgi:hypothetical protein
MWNDTDLQHDVEKELGWEPSVHAKQIGVIVKSGAVELGGHVDSFWEKCVAERCNLAKSSEVLLIKRARIRAHASAPRFRCMGGQKRETGLASIIASPRCSRSAALNGQVQCSRKSLKMLQQQKVVRRQAI